MFKLRQFSSWLWNTTRKKQVFVVVSCIVTSIFLLSKIPPPDFPNLIWPDFSLHLPFIEPKLRDKNIYLAVVVNSAATGQKYRELRKTIRETWGNSSLLQYGNLSWKLFFALGISVNNVEHGMNLQEASRDNDILIGNFEDNYKNLILKTFMSHYWVSWKFPSCRYVLKTDDDVYARVPKLLQWLEQRGAPGRFYGGYVDYGKQPIRDPANKWFISPKQYEKNYWPSFCLGAFHVLSTDILPLIFNYTKFGRKPFHTDDAYIGVATSELGIQATRIPGFELRRYVESRYRPRSACELITSITIGHLIDATTMKRYYDFYTKERKTAKYRWLRCLASSLRHFSFYALVMFSFTIYLTCN